MPCGTPSVYLAAAWPARLAGSVDSDGQGSLADVQAAAGGDAKGLGPRGLDQSGFGGPAEGEPVAHLAAQPASCMRHIRCTRLSERPPRGWCQTDATCTRYGCKFIATSAKEDRTNGKCMEAVDAASILAAYPQCRYPVCPLAASTSPAAGTSPAADFILGE